MNAPVTQQAHGGKGQGGTWKMRFIMPKSWTMATLPAPNDTRVKLVEVPGKRMVAIRFTWRASDNLIAAKTAELRNYAQ